MSSKKGKNKLMTYAPPVYPTTVPTEAELEIVYDDIDIYWAKYHNQYNKEMRAIMTELGLLPKGTYASVRARLDDLEARIIALET